MDGEQIQHVLISGIAIIAVVSLVITIVISIWKPWELALMRRHDRRQELRQKMELERFYFTIDRIKDESTKIKMLKEQCKKKTEEIAHLEKKLKLEPDKLKRLSLIYQLVQCNEDLTASDVRAKNMEVENVFRELDKIINE